MEWLASWGPQILTFLTVVLLALTAYLARRALIDASYPCVDCYLVLQDQPPNCVDFATRNSGHGWARSPKSRLRPTPLHHRCRRVGAVSSLAVVRQFAWRRPEIHLSLSCWWVFAGRSLGVAAPADDKLTVVTKTAQSDQEGGCQMILATHYRGLDRASGQLDAREIAGPLPAQIRIAGSSVQNLVEFSQCLANRQRGDVSVEMQCRRAAMEQKATR